MIKSPNFLFDLSDFELKSTKRSPSIQILKSKIENKLSELDPDKIEHRLKSNIYDLPFVKHENDDYKAEIIFIPKNKKYRDLNNENSIAIYETGSEWVSTNISIKNQILSKARYYKSIDRPLIVAANSIGRFNVFENEIIDILYGHNSHLYDVKKGDFEHYRINNGLYFNHKGLRSTNISAILITTVYPTNLHLFNY